MEYNKEYAKKVYAGLTKRGYTADELGDETKFVERMADEGNRKYLYDQVQKRGDAKMGSWEHFNSKMMEAAPVVEQRGEASAAVPGERAWWQTEVNAPKTESPYPVNPVEFQGQVDQEGKVIAERLPQARAAMSQRMLAGQTTQGAFNRFLAGDTYAKEGTPEYARAQRTQMRNKFVTLPEEQRKEWLGGDVEKVGKDFEAANGRKAKDELELFEWRTGGYSVAPEVATEDTDPNDIAKYNGYSANEINAGWGDEKARALLVKDRLTPQLEEAAARNVELLGKKEEELQKAYYDEYRRNAGTPGYFPDDTSWGGKGRAMNEEWRLLKAAANINKETEQLIDAAVNDRGGFTAFGRTLADVDTWLPLETGVELSALAGLKDVDPEKATPAQKALMEALAMRAAAEEQYSGDISWRYKAGSVVANMIPLWIEMLVNPLSGVGKAAAKKAMKALTGQGLEKEARRAVFDATSKAAKSRAIARAGFFGSLAGGAGMAATTSLPKVAVNAGLNTIGQAQYGLGYDGVGFEGFKPGGSYLKEFGKEFARTAIEHSTEQMGAEWFAKLLGKPVGWIAKGAEKVADKIPGAGKALRTAQDFLGPKWMDRFRTLAKSVNYNGPVEEFGEEFVSALMNVQVDGLDSLKEFFEGENLKVTLASVLIPSLPGYAGGVAEGALTGRYKAGVRDKQKQTAAFNRAAQSFGENREEWKNIAYNLNNADTFVEEMKRVYNSPDYTNEQKKNALEYAVHTLNYMRATGSDINVDENTQLLNGMLRESYGWAYENTVPEAVNGNVVIAADKALRDAEAEVRRMLALADDADIEAVINGRSVDEVAMGDDAVAEALRTYYAEKAIFEGMQDKMQNTRENEYAEADKSVDAVAHKENDVYSGNIYRTTLSQNGEEIFITGGKVVLDKDGYIDVNQSEGLVALINGEHKAIQPGNLREKVTVESVEALKAAKRAEIDARYRQQLNTFTYKDEQGNHTIQLVTRGEEMSRVLLDGVEQDMPTRLYDKIVAEVSQAESGKALQTENGKVKGENGVAPSENQSTVPTAEEVADAQAFADAYAANTLEAYQNYLDNHPEGAYRDGARNGIWTLEGTGVADVASITNARDVLERAAANEAQPQVAPGEEAQPTMELTPAQKREEVLKRIPTKGKERLWTEAEPADVAEYIRLLTADPAKQQAAADKFIADIKAKQAKVDAISALEMDEQIAYWESVKALLQGGQPTAETAPVVESAPVEEVETPQATNEMQEADLENVEKGQKAVEPVEENKPKVRGRKQVEKAVEKMRKADAEGNALEVLNNIQTAELNAKRGDEGAITPEELAEIDALKKKYAEQGYEMEDMTGKVYDEDMRLEAEFVIDESLPDGAEVIKSTLKPYIFKDGVLVQKAKVIVALSPVKAIKPVGKGYFGEIYDQFKNGFKAAFDFLVGKKRGEAVGVFNREGIGEIDLVWGDEKAGLSHILTKHVGEGKSFESLEDAKNGIADVVENGKVVFQDGDKVVIQKDGKIVTLRKNVREKGKKIADKNWILTAYDETKADDTSAISGTNKGQAAQPTVVSEGEGTTQSAKVQENTQKNGDVKPTLSQTSDQVVDNAPGQSGVEEIQEPRSVEETLENGDKRITNYNSRGEVATVATERDGKVVSVDSYDEGVLFEHTEYDTNGVSTSVTRYDKQGNVVSTQVFENSGVEKNRSGKVNTHSVIKSENEKKVLRERAAKWGKKLGVKIHIIESYDEVTDGGALKQIPKGRTPGWFSKGEVYLYMPHLVDEVDLDRTVVHETVAHKGIKQMLGEEFNKLLDNVWNAMSVPAKAKFLSYVGAGKNATQADRRAAADEYVASIAEGVYKKQGMTAEEKTIWQKFADWFRKKFNVDETKAEVLSKETLTDEDIAKMIRASYETLQSKKVDNEVASVDGETMASKDNEGTMFRISKTPAEFDAMMDLAVDNKGYVFPDLSTTLFPIVEIDYHSFTGETPFETTENARKFAKSLKGPQKGKIDGYDVELYFSTDAVDKLVSDKGIKKSQDIGGFKGGHLAVVENIFKVLEGSRDVEIHPNVKKLNEKREWDNGLDKSVLCHRYYSAVSVAGDEYRVMIMVKESRPTEAEHKITPYTVEVQAFKIEKTNLSDVPEGRANRTTQGEMASDRFTDGAKLLEGVEKSYDKGKKVLAVSENSSKGGTMFRKVFHGSGAQFDKFDHSFMGTGEGAQAFGWGTYVTEVEDIGRTYAGVGVTKLGSLQAKLGNIDSAISSLEKEVQRAEKDLTSDNETARHIAAYTLETASERRKALEEEKAAVEEEIKPYRNLYTVEIPDDNGSNYLHWEEVVPDEVIDNLWDKLRITYGEDVALNVSPKYGQDGEHLYKKLSRGIGGDKQASLFLSDMGFVGISYPAEAMTGGRADGARNYVIFNEADAVIEDRTMFRRANENQEIFVSNARKAVEEIKQEKATPQQWLAMIKKNGGLKAGEDAWMGLSEWLENNESKSLTKQEVLDFVNENAIKIEEVRYSQFGSGMMDEAAKKLETETKEIGWDAMQEKYPGIEDFFEYYNGEVLWSESMASEGEYEDFILDNKIVDANPADKAINERRESYTTEGLERKREIALVVPTIEPYNQSDEIHFGDAGDGRAIAWVRFGETTDSEGNRVLVIDEIQSKRHQDGREKGYKNPNAEAELEKVEDAYREAIKAEKAYNAELKEKYGYDSFEGSLFQRTEQFVNSLTEEEKAKREELKAKKNELAADYYALLNGTEGVPAAPFEKNWHELAMKRMLRLAAEEGFDKVAWTTGEQQAERYNLGKAFNDIEREDNPSIEGRRFVLNGANVETFQVDENGNIIDSTIEEAKNKPLVEVVGKDMAVKMMSLENGDMLEGEDLRIGGEGMKGFYDKMLPSFVSKYTKKWGAKVGTVEMPSLEQNNVMHSVDVTPEMKESVMEGQTMFSKGYTINGEPVTEEYVKAVVIANKWKKAHKGAAWYIIIKDGERLREQLEKEGFTAEDIEDAEKFLKKGTLAAYFPTADRVLIFNTNATELEIKGYLWHENAHRAFGKIYTQEEIEALFKDIVGDKEQEIRANLADMDYEEDEQAEEFMVRMLEDMYLAHPEYIETGRFKVANGDLKYETLTEVIKPLINFINNGNRQEARREADRKLGQAGLRLIDGKTGSGNAVEVRNPKTEEQAAQETAGGLTDGGVTERTLFRKAEQMGEDEVVLAENAVTALGEKLNIPARVVNDVESLPENKRDKKGWVENGEVVVVLDSHVSMEDAMQTVLHEVVGRKGLRAVMGEDFDALLDVVYRNLPKDVKSRINYVVMTRFVTPRQATEEYIAGLARKNSQDAVLNDIIRRMGDYFRGAMNLEVEDGELRYMLWKNNQRLQTPDVLSMLQDFVMETETNTGDNGTRFRVVNDTTEKYEKSVKGFWNKFKEAYYDRLRSVRKAQEIIAQETGMPISDSEDVYSYAEHLPSINKSMKEVFDITYMTPFVELLQKIYEKTFNGKKIDEKTLERYANAKHGLERNRELAVKKALTTFEEVKGRKVPVFNKDAYADWVAKKAAILNDGSLSWEQKQEALDRLAKTYGAKLKDYSGLTAIFDSNGGMKYKDINRAAIDYVLSMEAALGNDTKALWKLIKGMTGYSLKQSYESGLLAKEAYEVISSMYEFYVPLRGFTEKTAEDYYDYVASEARPLNSVIIAASGRKSEADNIFATILNMANSAIVYGNKNRLKQRVLNLATRHNSPLLSVDNAWYIKMGDDYILQLPNITENMTEEQIAEEHARFDAIMKEKEKNGEAVRHSQGLNIGVNVALDANKVQHAIRVKRNGREYIVWVNGSPTMANAINGMLKEDEVGFFGNAMDVVNKFRSKMVTQYSPTFVLTNLFRDVQSSSTVYGVRRGRRALGRFLKNVRRNSVKMGVLYWKYKHGALDENKLIERYFKEFLENGGETGYTEMISIDEYNKMLNELTEKMNIGNAPVRAIEAAGKGVEFANRCIENLCRFSAYMTSREDGVSILQSINDAKEVSVNFNRKGSGAMGAGILKRWFMFFNPAVQSVAQRILLLQNYPKRMIPIMAMELTAGAMKPYLYATLKALLFGGDDDDETWDDKFNNALGDYYNMTDYRRRSSIIFPTKDGSINPPLSHEARVLYGVGELITSIVNGHEKYDNIPSQVVNILGQSLPFNPVEGWSQNDNLTESLMKNLSPDAIKPFVEIAYNSDFAGNRIHNRSDYNEYLPEYMRGRKGTGAGFNAISKTISGGESGFERGWADRNLSVFANPSSLEHLVEGYLGGAYTFFNKAVKSVRWASGNEEFADSRNIPFVSSFYTSLDKYEANPDGERTRRDWEDAFKYYQEEVNIIDGKEKAAKAGEKQELPGAADLLKAMGENGDMLAIDIFNDGNKVLKELYADVDVARTAKDFDSVEELDKKIYAQKRAMVERMEQMAENPMIGYTFNTNKSDDEYGQRETYGDVRDMNVINEFQRELKPLFEAYVEELKTLGEIEQLALYQKNEKMVLLYNTLKRKEQLISNIKKAMKVNPEKADEYMDNIRRFRAEAVELINKYRNE